jgi:uncharacterized Zn finger protein (UPF0148 family)
MNTPRNSRSVRNTAEYARILAKFVAQIDMRPDWSVTLADLDRGVRQAIAMKEGSRKARLVICPACGIKRRDPGYTLCAVCAREARNEDEWQAKNKSPKPSPEESERLSEELLAKQRLAACEELYRLFKAGQLPDGCSVVSKSVTEIRIQSPKTLFILHLDTAAETTEQALATPAKKRGYGRRSRAKAEVVEFALKQPGAKTEAA